MCKKNTIITCCGHCVGLFLFQIKRLNDFIIKHLKTKNIIMKTLQTLLLGLALAALTTCASAQSSSPVNAYVLNDGHTQANLTPAASLPGDNVKGDSISENTLGSVEDVNNIAISRAYPGPVISEVHVDVSSGSEMPATIRLIDLSGRTALERPVKLNGGENHFDNMAGGVYQLIVQTDSKRIAYKLVKAR
jgi:hypothetical protein